MSRFLLATLLVLAGVTAGAWAQSPTEFEPYTLYPLSPGTEAQTVAIGDLNGDGRDDVVISAWWPSSLWVYYQQADGTLGSPMNLPAPNMPLGLAVGDLNGDGLADVTVGGTDGSLIVYYQQLSGTLGPPVYSMAAGWTNGIALGDFNSDGLTDMATSSNFSLVFVLTQNVSGTFGMSFYRYTGSNGRSIKALDYNADGKKDLALLLDSQICFILQGSFGTPQYLPAQWAHSLAAGDVTGDGLDDLVYSVASNQPNSVIGVYAQGVGGTAVTYPAYHYPTPLAVADVDNDGLNDVLTAHAGYETLSLLRQVPEGGLAPWESYPAPGVSSYQPGSIAVGDLNSDGLKDVAVVDWLNGLSVFLHKGNAPVDTVPPLVSVQVSGTSGQNGWYISPVEVTLTAEDTGGSGLKGVFYTLDGSNWFAYSSPFSVAAQGVSQIGYYAEDNAGNKAEVQWVEVKVDTKAPVITLIPSATSIWPPNGGVVGLSVQATGVDEASGLVNLHLKVVDEYGLVQPEMDVAASPVTVQLVASRNDNDADGRIYTLVLTGTDAAGNTAVAQATVTVPKGNPKDKGKDKNENAKKGK